MLVTVNSTGLWSKREILTIVIAMYAYFVKFTQNLKRAFPSELGDVMQRFK